MGQPNQLQSKHAALEPLFVDKVPEVTILMPCLNEAGTIGSCIAKAWRGLAEVQAVGEILIADNGSSDGSREIAASAGARVICVEERGYGAALIAGIMAARAKYVIMGDADDSYDFEKLGVFIEQLRRGSELVMGNRFRGGILPGAMPSIRFSRAAFGGENRYPCSDAANPWLPGRVIKFLFERAALKIKIRLNEIKREAPMSQVAHCARLRRAGRITFVQVVVLTVILILLIGLIVPMTGMLHKRASESGCMSNLAQMVQAYNTHNTKRTGASTQEAKRSWAQILKSQSSLPDRTYICPVVLESSPNYGSAAESWSQTMDFPQGKARVISSYGLNGWLLEPDRQVLRYSGGKAEHFVSPSSADAERVPVFGDAMWQDAWPHADDVTPTNLRDGDREYQDTPFERQHMLGRFTINRHNMAINVAFLDGHAETVELKNLKRLMWHNGFQVGDWRPPLPEK
jgi:prepilin-type processing-associated H-X9-DG protein